MKWRLFSLFLCLFVIFTFSSCGEKVEDSDFDLGTQDFSQRGITLKVPSSWVVIEQDGYTYYYPESGNGTAFLMIYLSQPGDGGDIVSLPKFKQNIKEFTKLIDNSKMLKCEIRKTKSGINYGYTKVTGKIANIDETMHLAAFDWGTGFVLISMASHTENKVDYYSDYHKILESIIIDESEDLENDLAPNLGTPEDAGNDISHEYDGVEMDGC